MIIRSKTMIGDVELDAVLHVRDLGEQDSKPVARTRIEWACNVVDAHPRCVARLYNIANLTAVA